MVQSYGENKTYSGDSGVWSVTDENAAEKVLQTIAARHETIKPEEFQALADEIALLISTLKIDIQNLPDKPAIDRHASVKAIQQNNKKLSVLVEALFEMSAKVDFQEARAAILAAKEARQKE